MCPALPDAKGNERRFPAWRSGPRPAVALAGVFLLALAVRIVYWCTPRLQFHARVPGPLTAGGIAQAGDSGSYTTLASSLLNGDGFRFRPGGEFSMLVGPAYPVFLAGLHFLFPHDWSPVLFAQIVLDAGTACLLVVLSQLALRRTLPGLLAGAAYACYYPNVVYTTWILTETLFTFLLTSFLVLLALALQRRRPPLFGWAGLAFAGACLTRPVPLLFLPLAVAFAAATASGWRESLRRSVWLVAGALVLLGPWLVQGPLHYGHWVPVTTGGGQNLLAGVSVDYDGDWGLQASTNSPLAQVYRRHLPPSETDRICTALALAELRRNARERPLAIVGLALKQVSRLYFNLPFHLKPSWRTYALAALNALILLAALAGVWRARRTRSVQLVACFLAFTTVLSSAVCSLVRYSAPLMPSLLFLAALGLLGVRSSPAEPPAAAAA